MRQADAQSPDSRPLIGFGHPGRQLSGSEIIRIATDSGYAINQESQGYEPWSTSERLKVTVTAGEPESELRIQGRALSPIDSGRISTEWPEYIATEALYSIIRISGTPNTEKTRGAARDEARKILQELVLLYFLAGRKQ